MFQYPKNPLTMLVLVRTKDNVIIQNIKGSNFHNTYEITNYNIAGSQEFYEPGGVYLSLLLAITILLYSVPTKVYLYLMH